MLMPSAKDLMDHLGMHDDKDEVRSFAATRVDAMPWGKDPMKLYNFGSPYAPSSG